MSVARKRKRQRKAKPARKHPGPVSKVTRELVQRVADRVAKGIPIRLALAGEPVSPEAYEKHLARHPELSALQEKAKLDYLEWAIDRMEKRARFQSNICWLLERRHSDLFARPAPVSVTVNQSTVCGLQEDVLEQMRKSAERRYAEAHAG